MLLAWAKSQEVSLRLAVAEVCSGEFGRRHTGKALRRLRHIADSDDTEVIEALRKAVRTLWQDSSLRLTLFHYVVEWCKNNTEVGYRTFVTLAASGGNRNLPMLLDEVGDEDGFTPRLDGLITGWRTLLQGEISQKANRSKVEDTIFLWLDTALEWPCLKEMILQALRNTVSMEYSGRRPIIDTLRINIYNWAQKDDVPDSAQRDELWRELVMLLDRDLSEAARRTRLTNNQGESEGSHKEEAPAE